MICPIIRHGRSLLYIAFIISSIQVNAQDSLFQTTLNKMEGYKTFSYQSIHKQKELFTSDTITEQQQALFSRMTTDRHFGYLFKIETLNKKDTSSDADFYDGVNLLHITPGDSTYYIQKIEAFNTLGTLPGCLKWIEGRLKKRGSKIQKTNDTTIGAVDSYHLLATVYDTIIDNQRNFTAVDIFIDKISGMPDDIVIKSRNTTFGAGVSTYYSESRYFKFTFDQHNVDIASFANPKGFHPMKTQPVTANEQMQLLTAGSMAPDWTLYTGDDKKMSLTQLRGRVVLLDFYFIGCFPCMESLKPLNKVYDKYKNQQLIIVSLTERDSKNAVLAFDKNYHIPYSGCVDAVDVVKSYHVKAFPTFYFIDKEGKIASILAGYDDNFEEKATSILDDLIKK